MSTSISTPWTGVSKNKTFVEFNSVMNNLETKIKKREFYLAAIENVKENTSVNDVFKHFKELDYRHYVVYFTAFMLLKTAKVKI